MELIILICILIVCIVILIVTLAKKNNSGNKEEAEKLKADINSATRNELSYAAKAVNENTQTSLSSLGTLLQNGQSQFTENMQGQLQQFQQANNAQIRLIHESNEKQMKLMNDQLTQMADKNEKKLEEMRRSMSEGMEAMRSENSAKLEQIRGTVDEKLQGVLEKRIAESFKSVSEQLEQVYKGLGEMQTLATDVGSLKKVLSGVKTRGILGEVQLAAILEEILTPDQYDLNAATVPGSSERVEFAIRLPGADDGSIVYLPIDSKFPGERYANLVDAKEGGDKAEIDAAYKALRTVIRSEAKDIREKYIAPPHTTAFGVMFLPFEGLYSEVVNSGLMEEIQRDFQVNIAGPSTMAAFLNSLQMGFRTLAIQKSSGQVWKTLGEVKTEFAKFEDALKKMQRHLNQTNDDLTNLIGTRTNMINRKLRDVQAISTDDDLDAEVVNGDVTD